MFIPQNHPKNHNREYEHAQWKKSPYFGPRWHWACSKSNFTRSHISSDRVRSGYEIMTRQVTKAASFGEEMTGAVLLGEEIMGAASLGEEVTGSRPLAEQLTGTASLRIGIDVQCISMRTCSGIFFCWRHTPRYKYLHVDKGQSHSNSCYKPVQSRAVGDSPMENISRTEHFWKGLVNNRMRPWVWNYDLTERTINLCDIVESLPKQFRNQSMRNICIQQTSSNPKKKKRKEIIQNLIKDHLYDFDNSYSSKIWSDWKKKRKLIFQLFTWYLF